MAKFFFKIGNCATLLHYLSQKITMGKLPNKVVFNFIIKTIVAIYKREFLDKDLRLIHSKKKTFKGQKIWQLFHHINYQLYLTAGMTQCDTIPDSGASYES